MSEWITTRPKKFAVLNDGTRKLYVSLSDIIAIEDDDDSHAFVYVGDMSFGMSHDECERLIAAMREAS